MSKPRKEISLELSPSDAIIFQGNFQTTVTTSTIDLKNPTEGTVAYKVKTTAPRRYCVRPNSGKLSAGEQQQVKILLQPNANNEDLSKHKFLLQTIEINAEQEEIPVDDLFKNKSLTDVSSSRKLVCKFEMVKENSSDNNNVVVGGDEKNNSNGEGESPPAYEATSLPETKPSPQKNNSNISQEATTTTSQVLPPRPKISAVPAEPAVLNKSATNPKPAATTNNNNNFTNSEEYKKMKDTIKILQEKLKAANAGSVSVTTTQQVQRDQNQASIMYKAIILVGILAFLFGFFMNGIACKC